VFHIVRRFLSALEKKYLAYITRTLLASLQRQNAENLKQIFPEKEYRGLSPNFHIHVSVSELYIPTMGLPVLLQEICRYIDTKIITQNIQET
jgi:hypothetical protein